MALPPNASPLGLLGGVTAKPPVIQHASTNIMDVKPSGPGHPAIGQLLAIMADYPGLPPSFISSVLGGIGSMAQSQQAQHQQTLSDARTGAAGLAAGGTPMSGVQDYISALYPKLADSPALSGTVGSLFGGSTDPSSMSPLAPAAATGTLTQADTAGIDTDVKAMATGFDGNGVPLPQTYTLHMAEMHVLQTLRTQGVSDPTTLEAARKYVDQRWQEYTGRAPAGPPGLSPVVPSDGGGTGVMQTAQSIPGGTFYQP